jgi:pimeloyl-ACP methyl ester carboxylesterase
MAAGTVIHHRVEGEGPDVVLLHGVGLDHTMWRRCAPALAPAYRLTSVDLRGHGASPPAPEGISLADLAEDVTRVLDDAGTGRVHLVGFSLGALVAAHLAACHPARVATLTLVSSVAPRSPAEREAVARRLEAARTDRAGAVEAAVARWFDAEWRRREPELAREVRRTLLATENASYLACYAVFATGDRAVAPLLERIAAPTLAITGGEDPGSTPEMSRRLARAIPDARAEIVPGVRHLLPLERPTALTAALTRHFERTTP